MKIKLLNKPDKTVTALEIGKKWLKVVQVDYFKTEKKVCFIDAFEIESLSDDDLIHMVTDLSHRVKIDSENLMISVPYSMALTKNLDLPSTNPLEIEDMVDLQIGKQALYSQDEIIRDYHALSSHMEGYSRILLVIVYREVIQKIFRIIEAAGLSIEKVGFGSEGLLSWGELAYTRTISIDKSVVLIDIDYDGIDFEVVVNGSPIFSRSLPLSLHDDLVPEQKWQDKFVEEVMRFIYAYQNEVTDKSVETIIISANSFARQRLREDFLREKIGLPVEIIDQLDKISKTDEALESYNNLSKKNLSFAGLVGGAFIFGKQSIDLMPQEVKVERNFKERGKDIYRMGIILVFILIIISSLFSGRLYNKERYLNQLNARLSEIKDKADMLENMLRETALIKDRISSRGTSLELIYETHEAVLPEMHLAMLVFDGRDSVILRGESSTMSEVFNFVGRLEKSEYFKNVQTRHTTQRREKDKDVISFEILCPLDVKYRNMDRHGL